MGSSAVVGLGMKAIDVTSLRWRQWRPEGEALHARDTADGAGGEWGTALAAAEMTAPGAVAMARDD